MSRLRVRAAAGVLALGCAAVLPASAAEADWVEDVSAWFSRLLGVEREAPLVPEPEVAPPPQGSPDLFASMPRVGFAEASLSRRIEEGQGTVELVVERTAVPGARTRVDVKVLDDTAKVGADVAAFERTYDFPEGETRLAIEVPLIDDDAFEPDESFEVVLVKAFGGLVEEGRRRARVVIVNDDPEPKPTPPPGRLALSPTPVGFGTVTLPASRLRELVVRNEGGQDLAIEDVQPGPAGGPFSVADDGCTGGWLAPGGSCTVVVRFAPRREGQWRGSVEVRGPGGRGEKVQLQGEALPAPVYEDPLAGRIRALRAARDGQGAAIETTLLPETPAEGLQRFRVKDPDWGHVGVEKGWFSLPVERERTITTDRYIGCVLESDINSQIAGPAVCVVERNVFGADGRSVLIPRGSRIVGVYQELARQGDTRLNVLWQRILTEGPPSQRGMTIQIGAGLQGLDAAGSTGLPGTIDTRLWERYGNAGLLTLFTVGAALATPQDNDSYAAANQALTENLGQITAQELESKLDIRPIMRVPAGTRLTIMPTVDFWFPRPDVLVADAEELKSRAAEGGGG